MKIEKKIETFIPKKCLIKLKHMGNVKEICYQNIVNNTINIKKLNENEYIYLPTGEILKCKHIKNRSENLSQVSQSLKRLRDYINTNIVEPLNCRWITLTYAENMTDTKKLYRDFQKFIQKLKYNFKEYKIEYIVAMEPQGRGAWHAHLILIFDRKAPYIPNKTIEKIWGLGFTKTKMLIDIDNVGAYLTAYLGDMEYNFDSLKVLAENNCDISNLKTKVIEIDNKQKKFIKGGRLFLYPPKFNLYRCSKGIKKPITEMLLYEDARKKIGYLKPTFTRTFTLTDYNLFGDMTFSKTISYEFYNLARVIPQD